MACDVNIANDSRVTLQLVASLTIIICDRDMFKIQAIDLLSTILNYILRWT